MIRKEINDNNKGRINKINETYDNFVHQIDQHNQNVNHNDSLIEYIHHYCTAIHDSDRSAVEVLVDNKYMVSKLLFDNNMELF